MKRLRTARPDRGRLIVVDLGGTWVRVTASGEPPRRWRARSPGATRLPALLARLWRRWRIARGDLAVLGVASRGVWTSAERRALASRLHRFAPRVVVISDVEAAYLAALGDSPGVLLLAGTGSIALGRDHGGRWARAGGLGALLGDDGSAFAIGRDWLRRPGANPLLARRIGRSSDAVPRIAAYTPTVLRRAGQGDRDARRIVREAQHALALLVITAARRLRLRSPVTVSWAGTLMRNASFRAGVWREVRRRGLRLSPVAPRAPAASPSAWRPLLERPRGV